MEPVLIGGMSRLVVCGGQVMRLECWCLWDGELRQTIVITRTEHGFRRITDTPQGSTSRLGSLEQILAGLKEGEQLVYSLLFESESVSREMIDSFGFGDFRIVAYDEE